MSLLRRGRSFRVWLVDTGEILRAGYRAAALPAVGETILVQKMKLDEDGAWKLDDIYTFRGAFVQAESLSQYLRGK